MTRLLTCLMALLGAVLVPAAATAQEGDGCVEIITTDPDGNEVDVTWDCPDETDGGSDGGGSGGDNASPATPVGGGGEGAGDPTCTWHSSPIHESEIREGPDGPESWWLYRYDCDDGTSGEQWRCQNCSSSVDDDAEGAEEVDWQARLEGLLLEATGAVDLPDPQLRHVYDSRPDGEVLGVVQAESWWWTESEAPVTTRSEDGPLWVEVTATPTLLEVDPGDGSAPISCPEGGTPYDFDVSYYDQVGGSDCFHVYAQTSADQPGEAFEVTATLSWNVQWVSGGPVASSGVLAADATTETLSLPVGEIQSVISQ